jgi:hypothetical protein
MQTVAGALVSADVDGGLETWNISFPDIKLFLRTDMTQSFPAVGHVYRVDFGAFVVELDFASETKMTYTGIRPDGSRTHPETVVIEATYIKDDVFMVTWQENDKTAVVHVEDYKNKVIYTNITNPDASFQKFKGTVTLIS